MSNNTLEEIDRRLAEMTDTLKNRKGDATIDWDKRLKEMEATFNERVAEQVKAAMNASPVRRVPGQDVEPTQTGAVKNTNRYFRNLKSLEKDGYYRDGGLQIKAADLYIAKRILDTQNQKGSNAMPGGLGRAASDDLNEVVKALTSTGSGTGDELVPTNMAAELWSDFFAASRVVSSLNQITMPTNPFDIPLGLGSVTWRKGTENAATSTSDPATAKSTLTATELITEQNWSYTLDEDAAVAMAPAIRERLAQSGAEIMDDFALNADATNAATGNINSDNASPAADAYYLSDGQDGIRHQWLVDNTNIGNSAGGDALVDLDITSLLAEMGKYAIDPMKLIIVCDFATYLNGFLQTGSGKPGEYVATMEKFGSDAIIKTGQLAAYRGIPIIPSASHRLTMSDGKVDTSGNTLGSFSVVNTSMWYVGFVRRLLIETDVDIRKRQYIMVSSMREAVASQGTRSTNTHTGGVYNILV